METTEIIAILTMIAVAGMSLFAPSTLSINEKPAQPSTVASSQDGSTQEKMRFLENYRQPINVFDREPPTVGGKTRHAKKVAPLKKDATRKHKK